MVNKRTDSEIVIQGMGTQHRDTECFLPYGQLVEIPPYHAEFSVATGMLHIYVLGEKDKAVETKGITGSVVIQFPDGKKVNEKLTPMGEALVVSAPVAPDKYFVAIATLKMKDKSFTARYSHKGKKEGK